MTWLLYAWAALLLLNAVVEWRHTRRQLATARGLEPSLPEVTP